MSHMRHLFLFVISYKVIFNQLQINSHKETNVGEAKIGAIIKAITDINLTKISLRCRYANAHSTTTRCACTKPPMQVLASRLRPSNYSSMSFPTRHMPIVQTAT